jgi:hypothetical protein
MAIAISREVTQGMGKPMEDDCGLLVSWTPGEVRHERRRTNSGDLAPLVAEGPHLLGDATPAS